MPRTMCPRWECRSAHSVTGISASARSSVSTMRSISPRVMTRGGDKVIVLLHADLSPSARQSAHHHGRSRRPPGFASIRSAPSFRVSARALRRRAYPCRVHRRPRDGASACEAHRSDTVHLRGSFDGVLLEQNLHIAQRHCRGGGVSAIGVYLHHPPVFRGSPWND